MQDFAGKWLKRKNCSIALLDIIWKMRKFKYLILPVFYKLRKIWSEIIYHGQLRGEGLFSNGQKFQRFGGRFSYVSNSLHHDRLSSLPCGKV